MSDNNNNSDILIADLMLRVAALEKLLIKKEMITQKEFVQEVEEISIQAAKIVLEKAGMSKNIDDFIFNLTKDDRKTTIINSTTETIIKKN